MILQHGSGEQFGCLGTSGSPTLFVIEPLMLAMRTMLPPFPKRAICRPAACAVNRTPFTFTSITCGMCSQSTDICPFCGNSLTSRNCDAGYSRQSV